jgi:NAD(P)-dependent dehydrogenase (short-subunit alcohol dehydrogenase family)
MRLKNRVALVTGGGKGMGKAISLAYAREGADVVVNDILYDRAREVAAEILASGHQALPDGADVSNSQAVNRMVKLAVDKFGKIDILVNCAGILLVRKIVEMTDSEWAKVLAVNLNGAFYCTRAVLAQSMVARGSGKIIHFASITASKGGIIGFTKALSRELASKRINVNAIAPGFIDTDQTKDEFVGENRERIRKQIAFRHIGLPNDIVGIAVFLASEESAYLTGQTIVVDGGVV